MNHNIMGSRKRKHSMENEDEELHIEEKIYIKDVVQCSPLLCLSDEILLEILNKCDCESLINLAKTCHRLNNIILEKSLWKEFNFLNTPKTGLDLRAIFNYLHEGTTAIKVRGMVGVYPQEEWKNETVTLRMLESFCDLCPNLEELVIYEGFLCLEKISITSFPHTLKKLSFNNCQVNIAHLFFSKLDDHMKQLEELELENCRWFDTHDLIVFSKLPKLRKLNLQGCMALSECVPYGSIATRFGFKTLEVLDIRNTPMSDSDIQCFNVTTSLKELIMECPLSYRSKRNDQSSDDDDSRPSPILRATQNRTLINTRNQHLQSLRPPSAQNVIAGPSSSSSTGQSTRQNTGELRENALIQNRPPLASNSGNRIEPGGPQHIIIVIGANGNGRDNVNGGNEINNANPNDNNNDQQRQRLSYEIVIENNSTRQSFYNRFLQFEREHGLALQPPEPTLISDRGICSFGLPSHGVQDGVVWIRAEPRLADTFIERLVVRHYRLVTDTSLRHLAARAPNLRFLDVTGTSVTREGIESFKLEKPDCIVVSNFH